MKTKQKREARAKMTIEQRKACNLKDRIRYKSLPEAKKRRKYFLFKQRHRSIPVQERSINDYVKRNEKEIRRKVRDFKIIVDGQEKIIADTPDFWVARRKQLAEHIVREKLNRQTQIQKRERILNHFNCKVKLDAESLKSFEKTKDLFSPKSPTKEIDWFKDVENAFNSLPLSPSRSNWMENCSTEFQCFLACMMSGATSDKSLFDGIYALRKLDWFNLEFLSSAGVEEIEQMEGLMLFIGFNWYSDVVARIVSASRRIKNHYKGIIPLEASELLSFFGVGRKISSLIINECGCYYRREEYPVPRHIVVDTHLKKVFPIIGWSNKETKSPSKIAAQVESWLDPKYYTLVNTVFCGLRQLSKDQDTRKLIIKHFREKDVDLKGILR